MEPNDMLINVIVACAVQHGSKQMKGIVRDIQENAIREFAEWVEEVLMEQVDGQTHLLRPQQT